MSTKPQQHVLVVDDEPDFATCLRMIFESEGFEVTMAGDGEQALSHVREAPPDLVTLDIQMSRKSGVLFYRQMKSDERLRTIPVIVISGLLGTNESAGPFIERFFDVGGLPLPEGYLDKPVERKALLATVRALTERQGGCMPSPPTRWMGIEVG